jgi:hypothetical protein
MRNIMTAMAEYESDLIAERWKDVHRHLRRQGRPSEGTNTPFGFRYDRTANTYVTHEPEADVVREIYDRYLRGESLRGITDELNERRVPTGQRGAKRWPHSSVAGMLENPAYAGYLKHDGEHLDGNWGPIIPEETWRCAFDLRQTTKERIRETRSPATGSGQYLLSDLRSLREEPPSPTEGATPPRGLRLPRLVTRTGLVRRRQLQTQRAETAVLREFARALRDQNVARPRKLKKAKGPTFEERLGDVERRMGRLVDMSLQATGALAQKTFEKRAADLEEEREAILREQRAVVVGEAEHEVRVEEIGRFFGEGWRPRSPNSGKPTTYPTTC